MAYFYNDLSENSHLFIKICSISFKNTFQNSWQKLSQFEISHYSVTSPLSSGHLHTQYQISLNLLSKILFMSKRGNNLVIVHVRVITQHQCGVECCLPDVDHVSWCAHKSSHSTGAASQENLLVEWHLSTFLGESFTPDVVHRKPRH